MTGLYFFGEPTVGSSADFLGKVTSIPDENDFGAIPNSRYTLMWFTIIVSLVAHFKCSVVIHVIPITEKALDHRPSTVVLIMSHRLRRSPNIKTTLGEHLVFAGCRQVCLLALDMPCAIGNALD